MIEWKGIKQLEQTSFGNKIYDFLDKQKIKSINILDVGCGNGRDSIFFLKKGFSVSVNDISEIGVQNILKSLKSIGLKLNTIIIGDIRTIDIEDNYNIIFASNSLHYFNKTDTESIFKSLFGKIKENGYLCIRIKKGKKDFLTQEYIENIFGKFKNIEIIEIKSLKDIHTDLNDKDYLTDFIDIIIKKNATSK